MDHKAKDVLLIIGAAFNVIILVLSIWMSIRMRQSDEMSSIDFTNIEQIKDDW
jgi:hypothetical protein